MRPLTIVLLVTAIAAGFIASLADDEHVILAARLMYSLAFVASLIAFARGLPRLPGDTGLAPSVPPGAKVGLRHG